MLPTKIKYLLLALMLSTSALWAQIPEGYVLLWSDEFDYTGAPDPTKWNYRLGAGGWGNNEVQTYTNSPTNSRVEDGKLIIEAHQTIVNGAPRYTSARLTTKEKAQWKYGRIEVRAKLPSETGTWPAIWLLAADTLHSEIFWPNNGEIDIMEAVGYEEDPLYRELVGNQELPNIHGTLHTADYFAGSSLGGKTFISDSSTEYHVYAVNWTADMIEFQVDDVTYFSVSVDQLFPRGIPSPDELWSSWPFTQRFFLILNIAIGGNWGGVFNSNFFPTSPYGASGIDHDGNWPQRMEVDWVRVWGEPPVTTPTSVPGLVLADEMDDSQGVLVRISRNDVSPTNLTAIDRGDWAEYVLDAAVGGTYTISTSVAALNPGGNFSLEVMETGSSIDNIVVPDTNGSQTYTTLELGTLELQAGLNTLRMYANSSTYSLAWFDLASEGAMWKGLPIDGFGNADTQSWLGWINVQLDPWIYSYSLNKYIYPLAVEEEIFHTDSQWIYIPK
ncbi:MAG: family 16 glycosylhydrolase [Puniceicoccaceae bacterium]